MSSKPLDLKLDNKQIVHIAAEVVVLLGITFYFSSEKKKLSKNIEEQAQKYEECQNRIQKLETTVQQLSMALGQMSQKLQMVDMALTNLNDSVNQRHKPPVRTHKKHVKHTTSVLPEKPTEHQPRQPKVQINPLPQVSTFLSSLPITTPASIQLEEEENDIDDEEQSDSDLDPEIQQELEDLDLSLKKQA